MRQRRTAGRHTAGRHAARRALCTALACVLAGGPGSARLWAQGAGGANRAPSGGPDVTVRGVAFDSLTGRPLAGAFISVEGASRSTVSGGDGSFALPRMAPGRYVFTMQHAALDSVGLSGITTRATVTDGSERVVLAVPSFERFWRTMCGVRSIPQDSGFVYGTIRDARTLEPVRDASIDVSWTDITKRDGSEAVQVNQQRWRVVARSDKSGDFAVCGLPNDAVVRVRGLGDSTATDLIDLPLTESRVRRRDLLLSSFSDTSARGGVAGFITDANGRPQYNVRVAAADVPEVRSNRDGRFVLGGVPAGTRQVEFLALGMMPVTAVVSVRAADTAQVAVTMRNVTTLDVVRVTGTATQRRNVLAIEARKRSGFGYTIDSTSIAPAQTLASVFTGVPGLKVSRSGVGTRFTILAKSPNGGDCEATIVLDGVPRVGQTDLELMRGSDVAAIEIFPRVYSVPSEFMGPRTASCGTVAVWTKNAFR